jgi:excisionase family DNA binding protein
MDTSCLEGPLANTSGWLPLSSAAARLGVHPNTLRRWANEGKVPCSLTAGGHRRFSTADLETYEKSQRKFRKVGGLEQHWAQKALGQTRHEVATSESAQTWLSDFGESDRDEFRTLGRQLLGLAMRYLSTQGSGSVLIRQARKIGCAYGRNSLRVHMPLDQTLRILMFFRDTMMLTAIDLPDVSELLPESNVRMFQRMSEIFNAVQLAVVACYQEVDELDPRV